MAATNRVRRFLRGGSPPDAGDDVVGVDDDASPLLLAAQDNEDWYAPSSLETPASAAAVAAAAARAASEEARKVEVSPSLMGRFLGEAEQGEEAAAGAVFSQLDSMPCRTSETVLVGRVNGRIILPLLEVVILDVEGSMSMGKAGLE
jgi:hypothetical protein